MPIRFHLDEHIPDSVASGLAQLDHAGIASSAQGSRSVGEKLRRLVLIYDLMSPDNMQRRVEFL